MTFEFCGEFGFCSRFPFVSILTLVIGAVAAIHWGVSMDQALDKTGDIKALDNLYKNLNYVCL